MRKPITQAGIDDMWLWIEEMRGEGWKTYQILRATRLRKSDLRSFVWHQNRGLRCLLQPYGHHKENMEALVDRSVEEYGNKEMGQ